MEFNYPLPERWKWMPLGELADTRGRAVVSGPFGSNISSKFFVDDGIPVIRGNNLTTGSQKFIDGGFVFVTPEKAKELGNVDALRDDIIFTAAGSLGQVGIIPEKTRFPRYIISNKQMRVRLNRDLIDPLFAFQWLSSSAMVEFIQRQNTGSSVPLINLSIVRRLPVPLPPLPEQKAIAAVLGALDDKIELNRRMNATLEALARALFQSWFVDFDPVRAKLDGRQPGFDKASLFPATFQGSQAGNIPNGWTVGKVRDLCTLNRDGVHPSDFPTELFDHFSLPAFDAGRTPKVELGSAIMSNKLVVTPNSVLLSKLNPHIPRIWLPDLHAARRSVCSTEFMVACSKPEVSREYLYSLFTSPPFASVYGTLVTGTTGSHQRIRSESVMEMQVVVPPPVLIQAFTDIVKPMFDRINRNTEQSRTLANLRDTLLPKLLSGELNVPAAKQTEEPVYA